MPVLWPSRDEFIDDLQFFIREYNSTGFAEPIPEPSPDRAVAAAAVIEALGAPIFGRQRFRSLTTRCAAALYELAKRHFFVNGNKRIATYFMLHLLELNGYMLNVSPERLALFVEHVAASRANDREGVIKATAAFIRRYVIELSTWRFHT